MHVPIKSKLPIPLQECLMMCASNVGILQCGDTNDIITGEEAADILPTCGNCFNDQHKPKVFKCSKIRCNQPQRRNIIHTLSLVFFRINFFCFHK